MCVERRLTSSEWDQVAAERTNASDHRASLRPARVAADATRATPLKQPKKPSQMNGVSNVAGSAKCEFAVMMIASPRNATVDCIHLRFPQQFPKLGSNSYARMMMRRAVAKSNRVLTVSEATRADLVELVNADPSKIEVIPHGCDPYFLETVDDRELSNVAKKYSLDRPFLLNVTNIKPHKNLKRLLESFGQLRRDYDDLDLVIAGGDFSQHPELLAACKSYGIEKRVKRLGFLPKKELRALYRLARIFVFPSLYEGAGLPPLEAMACGTPVVASDNSAIPEIVGRNGLLVNPYRVDAITEAIRSLLENSSFRDALGAQGKIRAQEFDWDKSARRVLDIYREVLTP